MTVENAETQGQPEVTSTQVEEVTTQGTETSGGTGDAGGNPAWNDVLSVLPQSLHSIVTPKLQEWDRGVQQRFDSIKNQYKPWEDLISSVDDPQVAASGIQLLRALESNPEGFWKALGDSYNFTPAQTAALQQAVEGEEETVSPADERVARVEQAVGQLAQMLLNERQAQQQQSWQQQLETELTKLTEKHGDYDRDWVLTQIAAGTKPDDAVTMYQTAINNKATQLAQKSGNAPAILGSGGGIPANNVDPTVLDSKGTKELVANMLRNAAQQS